MSEGSEKIDKACEDVDLLRGMLDHAESHLWGMACMLADVVRQDTDEGLRLRTLLYWHGIDFPADYLSDIFGVTVQSLHRAILPAVISVPCPTCWTVVKVEVPSRCVRTSTRAKPPHCPTCAEAKRIAKEEAERREREWLESAEYKDRQLAILKSMPYDEYLRTEHWRTTRSEALKAVNRRCQLCNGTERLNVHHRTYERRGCEAPEDLTVLCHGCHETFHRTRALVRTV